MDSGGFPKDFAGLWKMLQDFRESRDLSEVLQNFAGFGGVSVGFRRISRGDCGGGFAGCCAMRRDFAWGFGGS